MKKDKHQLDLFVPVIREVSVFNDPLKDVGKCICLNVLSMIIAINQLDNFFFLFVPLTVQ